MHQFILKSNVANVDLDVSDIDELLEMLVYDGQLEKFAFRSTTTGGSGYRPVPNFFKSQPPDIAATLVAAKSENWTNTTCSKCPVFQKCSSIGTITPATCRYFDEWLKL